MKKETPKIINRICGCEMELLGKRIHKKGCFWSKDLKLSLCNKAMKILK